MRALGVQLLVSACDRGGSSCPNVDALVRGASVDRRELEVVVAQCRATRWSHDVTKCLRDAPSDDVMERCFEQLSAAQQQGLRAAFEPIGNAVDAKGKAEKRAHEEAFHADLAKRDLARYVTRAEPCADYLDAIDTAGKQTTRCSGKGSSLETYAFQRLVIQQVEELATITDDMKLGETCARHAGTLREDAKQRCAARDAK